MNTYLISQLNQMSMLSSPESIKNRFENSELVSIPKPQIGVDSFGHFLERMSITGFESTKDSDFTSVKHH